MKKYLIKIYHGWSRLKTDIKIQAFMAIILLSTFIGTTYFQYQSNKITTETTLLDRRPYLSIRFSNPSYIVTASDTFIGGDILYTNYGKIPASDIKTHFFITTDMDKTNHTLEEYALENWGGNKTVSYLAPSEYDIISRRLSLSPAAKFYYINVVVSYSGIDRKKVYWISLKKVFRIINNTTLIEIDAEVIWDKDLHLKVPNPSAPNFSKYSKT